jgi:MFS family permease
VRRSVAALPARQQPLERTDRRLLGWAGASTIGGFAVGYQLAVIAGALLSLRRDLGLGNLEQGALVAVLPLGAIVGSLLNGRIADGLGRRSTLILDAGLLLAATALAATAPSYAVLVLARALVGVAVGSTSSTVPLYLSELAPAEIRGRAVSLNQLMLTLGIVAAYAVDYAFAGSGSWRAMFAVGAVPAAALLLGMLRAPETPAWQRAGGRGQPRADVRRLLQPALRGPLLIGVVLAAIQQLSGINAILYYVPTVMEHAGLSTSSSILASVLVGAVNVAATVVALQLVDRLGRRPLLFGSLAGMFVALCVLGLSLAAPHSAFGGSSVALLSILAYIVAFAVGIGPVFWLLAAEIFPARERAAGAGVATAVNWFANFLVGLLFLPLAGAIGQGATFWLFAVVCALGLVFVYRSVPETKGRTMD